MTLLDAIQAVIERGEGFMKGQQGKPAYVGYWARSFRSARKLSVAALEPWAIA